MTSVTTFKQRKSEGKPISVVTCYDTWSARILNNTDIDCLLVGDSLAVVMHGFDSTLHATMEMMALHTAAVARGAPDKFIVADMPFMSCSKGITATMDNAEQLVRAGARAVKVEGAGLLLPVIRRLVEAGVPVMGHLGLTPQSIHNLGGYRIQGKDETSAARIVEAARKLEAVGCFALVLECVPNRLGDRVSRSLSVPTIGIGAGPHTDGQVLVLQDLIGADPGFTPKFLRRYADADGLVGDAVQRFHRDVVAGSFPAMEETYG